MKLLHATLVILLGAGCDPSVSADVRRETLPNGAELVENFGSGTWSADEQWAFVQLTRIGSSDGTDEFASFSSVWDVTLDRLGRIYVLDRTSEDVRVFTSEGEFVRRIGRSGEGPGELKGPIGFAWSPTGDLWIVNLQNARYEIFDTAGNYRNSHPRNIGGWSYGWGGAFSQAGKLMEPTFYSDPETDQTRREYIAQTLDATGWSADTFPLPTYEVTSWRVEDGQSVFVATVPFSPTLRWQFDGNHGLWFGETDRYRLTHRSLIGDTIRVVERAVDRLPVTSAEIDAALARLEQSGPNIRGRVDMSLIPATKPAFDNVIVDDAGFLWVAQTRENEDVRGGATNTFDVFAPDGTFLGSLAGNIGMVPRPRVFGNRMVGVVHDELDVPYVVLYEIRNRNTRSP